LESTLAPQVKLLQLTLVGKNGTREFNYTPGMGLNRFNRQTYAAGVETNSTRVMDMEGNKWNQFRIIKIT